MPKTRADSNLRTFKKNQDDWSSEYGMGSGKREVLLPGEAKCSKYRSGQVPKFTQAIQAFRAFPLMLQEEVHIVIFHLLRLEQILQRRARITSSNGMVSEQQVLDVRLDRYIVVGASHLAAIHLAKHPSLTDWPHEPLPGSDLCICTSLYPITSVPILGSLQWTEGSIGRWMMIRLRGGGRQPIVWFTKWSHWSHLVTPHLVRPCSGGWRSWRWEIHQMLRPLRK